MSTISASAFFADATDTARATNSACAFDTAPSSLNAHARYVPPAGVPPPRCHREPFDPGGAEKKPRAPPAFSGAAPPACHRDPGDSGTAPGGFPGNPAPPGRVAEFSEALCQREPPEPREASAAAGNAPPPDADSAAEAAKNAKSPQKFLMRRLYRPEIPGKSFFVRRKTAPNRTAFRAIFRRGPCRKFFQSSSPRSPAR